MITPPPFGPNLGENEGGYSFFLGRDPKMNQNLCRFALRNPHLEPLKPQNFRLRRAFPPTRASWMPPSRAAPTRSQIWPVSENNGGVIHSFWTKNSHDFGAVLPLEIHILMFKIAKIFACGGYLPLRNHDIQVLKPQNFRLRRAFPLARAPWLNPIPGRPNGSQIWPL